MASSSPNKRRRTETDSIALLLSPIQTPTPPTPPTPPAPLSALAARRAAQSNLIPPAQERKIVTPEDSPNISDDSDVLASSSDEDAEEDAEEAEEEKARLKIEKKKARKRTLAAKKGAEKGSRYFNGAAGGGGGPERILVDSVEEQDDRVPVETELKERVKMGRGKRQRRERSAFMDPLCVSSFIPVWGENAHKVDWESSDPSGGGRTVHEGMIFCLETSETLIIHGAYDFSLLSGSVSFLASTLDSPRVGSINLPPSSHLTHQVYSPSSHPLPSLIALPLTWTQTVRLPNGSTTSASAVVLISGLRSGIEGVEKVLVGTGMGVGNGMWPGNNSRIVGWEGQGWKLITSPTPSLTAVRRIDPWEVALAFLGQSQTNNGGGERLVLLVEGPKRVGKSTFAKSLLNTLLSRYERVAYLDTDLGQPEFTPPGFVSLSVLSSPVYGPSFTHLGVPFNSHFLGSLSPASDPSSYLSAISALLEAYQLEVEFPLSPSSFLYSDTHKIHDRIPLVINTQGWVKGLGADLLQKIKEEAKPSIVYAFDPPAVIDDGWSNSRPTTPAPVTRPHGFLAGLQNEDGSPWRIVNLPAAQPSPLESKWSPADQRTLALISYFHSELPPLPSLPSSIDSLLPLRWDFSLPLISKAPFGVDWRPKSDMVERVYILNEEIPLQQMLWALNASVVAIVSTASPSHEPSTDISFPYSPDLLSPSPLTSKSLGLALIRSIDPQSNTLYLLTPLDPSHLDPQPICLVKGQLQLPLPLWVDFQANADDGGNEKGPGGVEWNKIPYLVGVGEAEGGRKRVRRNVMRRAHG